MPFGRQKARPEQLGWSPVKLEKAKSFFDSLPPASLVIIHQGKVLVEWGDPSLRIKISSNSFSAVGALDKYLIIRRPIEQIVKNSPRRTGKLIQFYFLNAAGM